MDVCVITWSYEYCSNDLFMELNGFTHVLSELVCGFFSWKSQEVSASGRKNPLISDVESGPLSVTIPARSTVHFA